MDVRLASAYDVTMLHADRLTETIYILSFGQGSGQTSDWEKLVINPHSVHTFFWSKVISSIQTEKQIIF